MRVRAKKTAPIHKGSEPTPKPVAEPTRIPAPVRGWTLSDNQASPNSGGARILDNYICDFSSIRPRKGYIAHATIADTVQSMWTYKTGSVERLFVADVSNIYDATSPADANVALTADVSGLSNGFWFAQQFGTAGGDYLYALNGQDDAQLYDGSTWTAIDAASSPAITGVTTSDLSFVFSFANRLFFVEQGTMSAWYLPVDSIGGAASQFSLAGVFKKGGSLWFGASWSSDSGEGLDDRCVFFSTEGEVAVYQGTNPGSAVDWAKVGVYEVSRPLGPKAIMKAGGDLLIATEEGLVSISEIASKDVAALSYTAISRDIETYWQSQARALTAIDWQIAKVTSENVMIVSQPESSPSENVCLVANMQTRAWSRFTNMDTQSLVVFSGDCYFGSTTGKVYQMQQSGSDDGLPYTAAYLGQFEGFGGVGLQKTAKLARPIFTSNTPINPKVAMNVDYSELMPTVPSAVDISSAEGWGLSIWDTSDWDATGTQAVSAGDGNWISLGVTGYAHAPIVLLTFGSVVAPNVEYIGMDATFIPGAMVA